MKNFPRIRFIPLMENRVTTLGDWGEDENGFWMTITEMSDWRMEFLVLIHELTEWAICQYMGVTTEEADAFDALFEKEYAQGLHPIEQEAGFDKRCPFRKGHIWGARMERLFSWFLGVNWDHYGDVAYNMMAQYGRNKGYEV